MNIDMKLDTKIVLVTGASRGIGRSIAETLATAGATVIGTATSDGGAEAISGYFKETGLKGSGKKLNVADPDSISAVLKEITEEHGTIEVLVNNAGITRDNLLMRMKDAEWDDIINTNLSSVFRLSKACLRDMMKARSGRIISIASVVGATGNAGQCNYAAAKAGIIGFSKSLAREVGSRGITVNVVAPGFIDTDMTKALSDDQRSAMMSTIPLGGLGQPKDIANAVLFLASNMGNYVTGETLHINGGMHMA